MPENYDPYADSAPAPKPDQNAASSTFASDPYTDSAPAPNGSDRPLNEQSKGERRFPLRGWEKSLANVGPNWVGSTLYASAETAVDAIPYAKYVISPEGRDQFMAMTPQEQTHALLLECANLELQIGGARIAKGVSAIATAIYPPLATPVGKVLPKFGKWMAESKVGGMIAGKSEAVGKPIPYEDAVSKVNLLADREAVTPFSYGDEAKKGLLRKGLAPDEAEAIVGQLHGEEGSLNSVIMDRKMAGKESTQAFDRLTRWEGGRLYPKRVLNDTLMSEFSEGQVRAKFYGQMFENILNKDVLHADASGATSKTIFKVYAERSFPELFKEGGSVGFGDLTPVQAANMFADMVENKGIAWEATYPKLMATMAPARVVFGMGERALGTMSNIYNEAKPALGNTNRNFFNHSLLFAKMLEQKGAYESVSIKETGEFSVKKADWLTPKVQDDAYRILRLMDDFSETGRQAARDGNQAVVDEMKTKIAETTKGIDPHAQILINATRDLFDHLFAEHAKLQIPRVFGKAGLTRLGQAKIDELMSGPNGLNYEIDRLFSTAAETSPTEKMTGLREMLEGVRKRLDFAGDSHPYFKATGSELSETLAELDKNLNLDKQGGFLNYYDNYAARVAQHEDTLLEGWRGGLWEGRQAFYNKMRQLEKMKGEPVDFGTMISARLMAHAKEHFLYDSVDKVISFAKNLPPAWGEYAESYIGGILGTPTMADYKTAMFLTKTIGNFEKFFGVGEGLWSEQRTANLAYGLQNLSYLGALGAKPFSAIRHLFQPLITGTADLGSVSDLWHIAQGYKRAFNPEFRQYLNSIGAIEEYAPEIHLRPKILPQGKMFLGKEMPTLEGVRDVAMWMFKTAYNYSRYTVGGAADIKWSNLMKVFDDRVVGPNDVARFSKQLGLGGRYEWVKANIEDQLLRGKIGEAKATYIKDVINDTQYTFGVADAPVVIRKYGIVSKTGTQFHSWWLNYAQLLQKWMTTGESPGAKVERLFVGMLSQGIAFSLMSQVWGMRAAAKTVFLGPIPSEVNEFNIPATWKPIYHTTAAILKMPDSVIEATLGDKKVLSTPTARHTKAFLNASTIFVPGGLQLMNMYRGAKEEGWTGFSKSIIGIPPTPKKDQ